MIENRLVELNKLYDPPHSTTAIVLVLGLEGFETKSLLDVNDKKSIFSRLRFDYETSSIYNLSYPSKIINFKKVEKCNTNTIVEEYAELVKSALLKKYKSVTIISYCLGGFYSSMMLSKLNLTIDKNQSFTTRFTLILIDVPHYCTSETMANWFVKLTEALRIYTDDIVENMSNWKLQILPEKLVFLKDRSYAIVSTKNSWVKPMLPEAFLPPSRVFMINEKHENLLMSHEQGDWELYRIITTIINDQIHIQSIQDAQPY